MVERLRPGIYAIVGVPGSWERDAFAALLYAGPTAVLCSGAAAYVHRLWDVAGAPVSVLFPRGSARPLAGIHVCTTTVLPDRHVVASGPLRVTSVPRTLRDLSRTRGARWAERALFDACRRGLTDIDEVRACLDDFRRNPKAICLAAAQYDPAFDRLRSPKEVDAVIAIRAAGLPTPEVDHLVQIGSQRRYIDLAYPLVRLAIEVDGRTTHSLPFDVAADRARQTELEALGWTVIRIPTRWLTGDCHRAIVRIRTALLELGHPAVT